MKDGRICAAIEKERITRIKQDGYNDTDAITYCLEKENISIEDVSLIVQNSPLCAFESGQAYFYGQRLIQNESPIPVVTISHHLAHAYSAIGTCPFKEFAVLVIDGAGNSLDHCIDLNGENVILNNTKIHFDLPGIYKECDSYYSFNDNRCTTICKAFSHIRMDFYEQIFMSTYTEDSIGGLYGGASKYCFQSKYDAGKLMGLAPYGDPSAYRQEIFQFSDGKVFIDHAVLKGFRQPSRSYEDFRKGFQYYANIANWIQREVEKAVLYVIDSRYRIYPSDNLAYAGGVALNAVINSKIIKKSHFKHLYIQPAAGDNGISLGCAFYGWLEILKNERVHNGSTTCFGKKYSYKNTKHLLRNYHQISNPVVVKKTIDSFFNEIASNHKLENLSGNHIIIQFNIRNAGTYQVRIDEAIIEGKNDIVGKPTSEVSIENTDFFWSLLYPTYFNTLIGTGNISISNSNEFNYFLRATGLNTRSKLNCSTSAVSFSDFIHFEGEGYILETARLLAEGNIIGWFQDECEFGPRALGRRSILADPTKKGVRDFINSQIKLREDFRPFAPSVLLEDVSNYFDTETEAPYMITVCKVNPEWKEKIRDVVHEDGTSRVQTVTAEWNPKYYMLLQEFKQLTGISMLLNTSFNGRGMPIVETPEDALLFFLNCKLDYLVINDLIIKKVN